MADLAMPRLSDSMEEGTILKWLKAAGDQVKRGEELVEIETDKANMTYEADANGELEIVAQEGDTLPVGETIARIGGGGSSSKKSSEKREIKEEQSPAKAPIANSQEQPAQTTEVAQPKASENGSGERPKASPVAKRMARERGISLSDIQGSGPGGRIVKLDVESANGKQAPAKQTPGPPEDKQQTQAQSPPTPPAPKPASSVVAETGSIKGDVETQELSRLQQTIARRMAESKATAPEFVLNIEVDMESAVQLRNQLKTSSESKPPSFNDFVVKAAALALRDFPRANGAYRDGKFELHSRINVGIAVAGQDALIVPTIFDADRKSLGEISRDSRAVAEKVRAGSITPPELAGGTFTVSNLGMYGIQSFTAVINPPQAAILAVGAMVQKPVVIDNEISIRNRMQLTLSCDHRILYGADAAEFFGRIRERLENPLLLAL